MKSYQFHFGPFANGIDLVIKTNFNLRFSNYFNSFIIVYLYIHIVRVINLKHILEIIRQNF
jgi:hypothetical protein